MGGELLLVFRQEVCFDKGLHSDTGFRTYCKDMLQFEVSVPPLFISQQKDRSLSAFGRCGTFEK